MHPTRVVLSKHFNGPLRSLFVLKASDVDQWENYYKVRADAFMLDLEDAVLPKNKAKIREKFAGIVPKIPPHANPWIRINPVHEGLYWFKDVEMTVHPNLKGFVVSKVRHEDEIFELEKLLSGLEKERNYKPGCMKLMPLVETPECYDRMTQIAHASQRLSGIMIGSHDLQAEIFSSSAFTDTTEMFGCRALMAAKSAGMGVLQSPQVALDSHSLLEKSCLRAYQQGFMGRLCLTPAQVIAANNSFRPAYPDIRDATVILANQEKGIGVYQNSEQESRQMAGPPNIAWAKQVLELDALVHEREQHVHVLAKRELGLKTPQYFRLTPTTAIENAIEDNNLKQSNEITIDSSFRAAWNASLVTASRLHTSNDFAKAHGFDSMLVPYSMLYVLASALKPGEKSPKLSKPVEYGYARQLKPVYYGDTLVSDSEVINVKKHNDSLDLVLSKLSVSRRVAPNQSELVFQMTRQDYHTSGSRAVPDAKLFETLGDTHLENVSGVPVESNLPDELRHKITNLQNLEGVVKNQVLKSGETYVHRFIYSFNYFDFEPITNIFGVDNKAYRKAANLIPDDVLAMEPLVLAKCLNNILFDFGEILWSTVDRSVTLNRVIEGSMLSSMSYVVDVQPLPKNPNIEEVKLITVGLRDMDPSFLSTLAIPAEVLTRIHQPIHYEKIAETHCPELYRKLVNATEWKILRPAVSSERMRNINVVG